MTSQKTAAEETSVEGEGRGKKREREARDEGAGEAREGQNFRAPFGPFPPLLRPATQAILCLTASGTISIFTRNGFKFLTNLKRKTSQFEIAVKVIPEYCIARFTAHDFCVISYFLSIYSAVFWPESGKLINISL